MRIMLVIVADTSKPNTWKKDTGRSGFKAILIDIEIEAILSERETATERVLKKRIPVLFPVPHPTPPHPSLSSALSNQYFLCGNIQQVICLSEPGLFHFTELSIF